MGEKKVFSIQGFNDGHYRQTERYVKAVDDLFNRATVEIAALMAKGVYDGDKAFSFKDYPGVDAQVRKIVNGLAAKMKAVVETGTREQWLYACKKNEAFVASIMDTTKLTKARLEEMQDRNLDALKTFQTRKVNGMDLSKRIWKYTGQYKEQIEVGLDVGLGEGRSAQQLSRDLRQNLVDPDRLFRRVRDKRGNLQLSKAAAAFRPGQGVYRSSYKNAMRLTRTEVNMAYRESDYLKNQQLDFIVGYEVHRANRLKEFKCDLCEKLKGKYPKWFVFKGWHPQCRCYTTTILMDDETLNENELGDLRAALYGTEYKKQSAKNEITDVPQGFKDWVAANEERSKGWKSAPYFIRDNFVDGDLTEGLIHDVPIISKPVRTEAEKQELQHKWNTRVAGRKYNEHLQDVDEKYGDESEAIAAFIDRIEAEIERGAPVSRISEMVDKLDHKVDVKDAWDERREVNRLETLLVDVKGLKSQYSTPEIEAVFSAVEAKLAGWAGLSLKEQAEKLKYEVNWVEDNKKYPTWRLAQDAYKKRLVEVEYLIAKQEIETGVASAMVFAATTKSDKVKALASELKLMLSGNAPIASLQQKALALKNEVAKLEAAKAAREAKKFTGGLNLPDIPEPEIKRLLDDFEVNKVTDIDKVMRKQTEDVWKTLTAEEKNVLTKYTQTYNYLNEPLRGIPYYGSTTPNAEHVRDLPILTNAISKFKLQQNMVVRRGVDNFTIKSLGYNLNGLKVGDEFIDKGFLSTAMHRSKGFFHNTHEFIIVCPKGSQGVFAEPFSRYTDDDKFFYANNPQNANLWNGVTKETIKGEFEWIGQRGCMFKVLRKEGKTVYLQIIGQLK